MQENNNNRKNTPTRYSVSYRSGAKRVAEAKNANRQELYNAKTAAERIAEKYGTIGIDEGRKEIERISESASDAALYDEQNQRKSVKSGTKKQERRSAKSNAANHERKQANQTGAERKPVKSDAVKTERRQINQAREKLKKKPAKPASQRPANVAAEKSERNKTRENAVPAPKRQESSNVKAANQTKNTSAEKKKKGKRENNQPEKKKKIWPRVVLVIVAIIAIMAIVVVINVGSVKAQATNLKDELSTAMTYIEEGDMTSLDESVVKITDSIDGLERSMNGSFWTAMSNVPVVGSDVKSIRELVSILGDFSGEVLNPLVEVVKENPLSELKVGNGYNVKIIRNYLDFAKTLVPEIQTLSEQLDGIHLSILSGTMEQYTEKIKKVTDIYASIEDYLPLIESILNVDEDRTYVLAAQNSAELRAAGGFPGSVGLITIRDGILEIGDFDSVYNMFETDTPGGLYGVTAKETKIFTEQFSSWAHDATYNPDFKRVGEIWCHNYEEKYGEKLDGAISLTPVVIQRLLESTGKSVTLSDGTLIDGTNATKVLQHDVYWKYLANEETVLEGNAEADQVFSDTVKQVMGILTDDIGISTFTGLFDVFMQGAQDRTVLMYLQDDKEEEYVENCGFSGRLNYEKDNPKAGVYFSLCDPSKLGWYVDIDTSILSEETLSDGTKEYNVQVVIRNNISGDDLNGSTYIIGNYEGSVMYNIELTAPMGGDMSDFTTDPYLCLYETKYEDLDMVYATEVFMDPGSSITITYKVTTAKGVETPLSFDTTPTLQAYRQ